MLLTMDRECEKQRKVHTLNFVPLSRDNTRNIYEFPFPWRLECVSWLASLTVNMYIFLCISQTVAKKEHVYASSRTVFPEGGLLESVHVWSGEGLQRGQVSG